MRSSGPTIPNCCGGSVTEVESFLTTARPAGVELSDTEVNAYYTEQRRAAALVGLDPVSVPGTAAAVQTYYRTVRPDLRMTRDATDTALFLTVPPAPRRGPWSRTVPPVRNLPPLRSPPQRPARVRVGPLQRADARPPPTTPSPALRRRPGNCDGSRTRCTAAQAQPGKPRPGRHPPRPPARRR